MEQFGFKLVVHGVFVRAFMHQRNRLSGDLGVLQLLVWDVVAGSPAEKMGPLIALLLLGLPFTSKPTSQGVEVRK